MKARELALGVRFAVTGGTGARLRTALMTTGVALAVAVLLLATSAPSMLNARNQRQSAAQPVIAVQGHGHPRLLALDSFTSFGSDQIGGLTVQQTGANPPLPPGLTRLPKPGQMFVSPALEKLLQGPGGTELRHRLGARVVGTISEPGLLSPSEVSFVRGSSVLSSLGPDADAFPVSHFGSSLSSGGAIPLETLLVIVMVVVLLTPVVIFVATAARFGGEDRDRRLAALRLVGADLGSTATIAAGEALLAATIGVLIGIGLFVLGRALTPSISIAGVSVFSNNINPSPVLAALVVILVPVCSVIATLSGMRGLAIDPLGVTRRVLPRSRRLWWRVALPVLGLALLIPLTGSGSGLSSTGGQVATAAGVLLVLIGVVALLPWAVESTVRRAPSGPAPWLLAVRRLRSEASTTGRVVGAIGLAVAGAIALQMVFAAAQSSESLNGGGNQSVTVARPIALVSIPSDRNLKMSTLAELRAVPSVDQVSHVSYDRGLIQATVTLRNTSTRALAQLEDRAADINTLASIDDVDENGSGTTLQNLRNIVAAGAFVVLLTIGASMLLAAIEQLRERRRVLAVLAAFGTKRTTMTWSVLIQTAIPIAIGMALALGLGSALGFVLTKVGDEPAVYDWGTVALLVGAGAMVTATVTLLTMPLLWRLMSPEALRVE